MIQANELRIGNKVLFDGNIISVLSGDIHYASENIDAFEPIPLTPEILEKCGFEIDNDAANYESEKPCYRNGTLFLTNNFDPCVKDQYDQLVYIGNEIKYLHQLQNLYFTLTGEELPVIMPQNVAK